MAGTAGVCHLLGLNAESGAMGTLRCAGMPPAVAIVLVPLSALTLVALPAAARAGSVVPFRWTPGQIEVEVSVNGTALEWFIVNSGAEYSVLDDQLAQRLHLRTTPQFGRSFRARRLAARAQPVDASRQQVAA